MRSTMPVCEHRRRAHKASCPLLVHDCVVTTYHKVSQCLVSGQLRLLQVSAPRAPACHDAVVWGVSVAGGAQDRVTGALTRCARVTAGVWGGPLMDSQRLSELTIGMVALIERRRREFWVDERVHRLPGEDQCCRSWRESWRAGDRRHSPGVARLSHATKPTMRAQFSLALVFGCCVAHVGREWHCACHSRLGVCHSRLGVWPAVRATAG